MFADLRELVAQISEAADQQNEGAGMIAESAGSLSEAAKEITQLIKESTKRVQEGAGLSEKVGQSLAAIVAAAASAEELGSQAQGLRNLVKRFTV